LNETERLEPLGENALKVRRWRVAIGTLASLVVTVGGVLFVTTIGDPPAWLWAVPALCAAVGAVSWWWAGVGYARWGWRLTPELFEVRRGVVFRRQHLVPRSRIQNVTTKGGPLQRRFGVLTLAVHTAGSRTKNVEVRDMAAEHAHEIRRRLGLA